jgi:large subunit ribosomal protein L22
MAYNYTFQQYDEKKMARAVGRSLPISPKQSVEICNHLRHRSIAQAKAILGRVLEMKAAIPFKRFNKDVGHKPGIAAGRYPQIASKEILALLNSVEANAQHKGLGADLYITHMNAHRAPPGPRAGRTPGEAKRAHVEIIVEEKKVEKKKYTPKKGAKK